MTQGEQLNFKLSPADEAKPTSDSFPNLTEHMKQVFSEKIEAINIKVCETKAIGEVYSFKKDG